MLFQRRWTLKCDVIILLKCSMLREQKLHQKVTSFNIWWNTFDCVSEDSTMEMYFFKMHNYSLIVQIYCFEVKLHYVCFSGKAMNYRILIYQLLLQVKLESTSKFKNKSVLHDLYSKEFLRTNSTSVHLLKLFNVIIIFNSLERWSGIYFHLNRYIVLVVHLPLY